MEGDGLEAGRIGDSYGLVMSSNQKHGHELEGCFFSLADCSLTLAGCKRLRYPAIFFICHLVMLGKEYDSRELLASSLTRWFLPSESAGQT